MKLQTSIKTPTSNKQLGVASVITAIGSCFSQNILERLFLAGFAGSQNPNGIIYNAVSISDAIDRIVDEIFYNENDFFAYNEFYHSWLHHGRFSRKSIEKSISATNQELSDFRDNLKKSSLFVMTPSSSVVYQHIQENKIVANCHKIPNAEFSRKLLTVEENYSALRNIIQKVSQLNPAVSILITLSPVRHYPGDLVLNARSKAHLLAAIHQCVDTFENVHYFPAYEIVLDELRDYRFFNEDMLHPNELTRKIIFNRFIDTYFDNDCKVKIREAENKIKKEKHRPLGLAE